MDILSKDSNHFIFLSSTKNLYFTYLKVSRHNLIYMRSLTSLRHIFNIKLFVFNKLTMI